MTYTHKLQYAGAEPYEREAERLPYPVFEALTNGADDIGLYEELAQVRFLVDELESDLDGTDGVPDAVHDAVFHAADRPAASLRDAVGTYVAEWLVRRADWLVDEWGLEADVVADACAEYGVADVTEVLSDG